MPRVRLTARAITPSWLTPGLLLGSLPRSLSQSGPFVGHECRGQWSDIGERRSYIAGSVYTPGEPPSEPQQIRTPTASRAGRIHVSFYLLRLGDPTSRAEVRRPRITRSTRFLVVPVVDNSCEQWRRAREPSVAGRLCEIGVPHGAPMPVRRAKRIRLRIGIDDDAGLNAAQPLQNGSFLRYMPLGAIAVLPAITCGRSEGAKPGDRYATCRIRTELALDRRSWYHSRQSGEAMWEIPAQTERCGIEISRALTTHRCR